MAPVAHHKTSAAKSRQSAKTASPKKSAKERPKSTKFNPVKELRQRLQLNQAVFAQLLPVSVRSLATLESGRPPTDVISRRLVELRRLMNALTEVIQKEALGKWLTTPNHAFGDLKPLEVIDRGESDRIWSMIYFLRSGVPS